MSVGEAGIVRLLEFLHLRDAAAVRTTIARLKVAQRKKAVATPFGRTDLHISGLADVPNAVVDTTSPWRVSFSEVPTRLKDDWPSGKVSAAPAVASPRGSMSTHVAIRRDTPTAIRNVSRELRFAPACHGRSDLACLQNRG